MLVVHFVQPIACWIPFVQGRLLPDGRTSGLGFDIDCQDSDEDVANHRGQIDA